MKPGAQIVLAAAARFYTPLIVLLGLSLLAARAPGGGVGFIAGLAFVAALILHALVFGAAASRAAFPPWIARIALSLGLALALVGRRHPARMRRKSLRPDCARRRRRAARSSSRC
ncbi:MAG: MnhB domain-containing protein [Hyphomonadaceae bacterium]